MLPDLDAPLPEGLPIPVDDGACSHLLGLSLPSLPLPATTGQWVNLGALSGRIVIYCYPMTAQPGCALPAAWDEIPGARGCTPQACAFRDHYRELSALGAAVYGLSTQDTEYQQEAVARLHLPYPLLSDAQWAFAKALDLPLFEVNAMMLIKRLTLMIEDGKIRKVFYPVFPPDRNAEDVLVWLRSH
jgi:peroxiredoxin